MPQAQRNFRTPRRSLTVWYVVGVDGGMRALAVALVLALLTPLWARADAPRPPAIRKPPPPAALADAPDPLDVPADVQRLRESWLQCTAAAAKGHVRSRRPAAAVADAALQRCKAPEQALARALNRQLGPDGAARVLERVRETDRANLIQAVEELRAAPK